MMKKRFMQPAMCCPRIVLCVGLGLFCLTGGCAGDHHDAAKSEYKTVVEPPRRDSNSAHDKNERALVLMEKENYSDAETVLKQALEDDVAYGPAHNTLGLLYYTRHQWYLAAWEFQYAVKLMPDNAGVRNNLGLVFEASGKLDQAVTAYEKAKTMEPDNAQFLGNLTRARVRRGDTGPEIRELLTTLIALDTRPQWIQWAKGKLLGMK